MTHYLRLIALSLVAIFSVTASVYAQQIPGAPAYQLPQTVVPQVWYGSGAPTAALGFPTQPGDIYLDTTNHVAYLCAALSSARNGVYLAGPPACTSVGVGNWTQIVGSNGPSNNIGLQAIQVCHAQYSFAVDGGGSPGLITPANNCTMPANSIIFNEIIDWTTAATGATNTTSIGVSGTGGGAAILLGATAVASLTGIVQGVIVPQTASGWKKITTAGSVTLTTATAALTAGVADIFVFYLTASN